LRFPFQLLKIFQLYHILFFVSDLEFVRQSFPPETRMLDLLSAKYLVRNASVVSMTSGQVGVTFHRSNSLLSHSAWSLWRGG